MIVVTHIVLDRYRAAKYLVWARNLLAPASRWVKWADVQVNQGSPVTVPSGLANALVIVADNTVHLAINAAALRGGGDGDDGVPVRTLSPHRPQTAVTGQPSRAISREGIDLGVRGYSMTVVAVPTVVGGAANVALYFWPLSMRASCLL
ncbi:hypothetical protein [Streptomyces sp. CB00316]|uniref:hypothetical protein n=1 Tax=Streptomyces sp. CB00316 TaxID=1703932 RepID=UPI000AB41692|nr:hypothetical protein [Streptomyces sp. CB00316]